MSCTSEYSEGGRVDKLCTFEGVANSPQTLLSSGKSSQDKSIPRSRSRGRICRNSASHVMVVTLSHSCLLALWTAPVESQNPESASRQRNASISPPHSGLGCTNCCNNDNWSSTMVCIDCDSCTRISELSSLPGMHVCLSVSVARQTSPLYTSALHSSPVLAFCE